MSSGEGNDSVLVLLLGIAARYIKYFIKFKSAPRCITAEVGFSTE